MQIAPTGSGRRVAAAAAVALLATACGSENDRIPEANPAAPAETANEARTAALEWLADQPVDGIVHNRLYEYDDYGLSADIAMVLAETDQSAAREIGDAVAENAKAYVSPGFGTLVSAGAAAKLVLLSQAIGAEPPQVGRKDALGVLESRVTSKGPSSGRLTDKVDPDEKRAADYANTIVQAYAVRALTGAGSEQADAATDFLLEQQCSDGYFRVFFTADPAAEDQSCDGDKAARPDVDATAFALTALQESEDPEATDAVARATEWLRGQQADDGSFEAGEPVAPNANSTGLAGAVLGEAGEDDAAGQAATWVAEHQLACGKDEGAIAYDDTALAAGKVTKKTEGQFQLATVQAVPVLEHLPDDFEREAC